MLKTIKYFLIAIAIYFLTLFIFRLEPFFLFNDNLKTDNTITYTNIEKIDWITVLTFWSWSNYKKWYFHWSQLKDQINNMLDFVKYDMLWNDYYRWSPVFSFLQFKAKQFIDYIPQDYLEEMKWIADWAWVSFNEILFINTYDDLLQIAGCSSIIIPRKKNFSNVFVHARNLDYPINILAKNKLVIKYPTHISIWFPWYIGVVTWVWYKWISLSNHTAYSSNKWEYWIPSWFLYRKILEKASSLEVVKNILKTEKRTIANNLMVWSYKENKWMVAEFDSKNIDFRKLIYKNIIVSTNHYRTYTMKKYSLNSEWTRYKSFFNKIINIKKINIDRVKEIMWDYSDTRDWETIANNWTVQSVIMIPELKKVFVANWKNIPVTNWEYIEINY